MSSADESHISQCDNHLKNLGRLIEEKRQSLNMTRKELANAINISIDGEQLILSWENNESEPSKLEMDKIFNFPQSQYLNPNNSEYTMIDLFAGIGGTRLGFQRHGNIKTVFSSECDKFAIKTYSANFGEEPSGDITQINEKNIPNHDILVAGFPCQAFSMAGLRKGFEDTRGTLFFEVARILKEKRPHTFMLENVKNLARHDNGKTFEVILNVLKELNYTVEYEFLNSRDFGLPQNRERIYIVGFNNYTIKNSKLFTFPTPPHTATRLADILEENVDSKYTISDKLWSSHKLRKKKHKLKGNGFGYSLFDEDSVYTSTLSARYYKDGSEILINQGLGRNPRKLTPREAARLQGFPENYIIPVSDTQAYKQFGNSVSVPVVYEVASMIIDILNAANINKRYS